jgi:hypothetical protein
MEEVYDDDCFFQTEKDVLSQEISATTVEDALEIDSLLAIPHVRVVKRPRDTEGPEAHRRAPQSIPNIRPQGIVSPEGFMKLWLQLDDLV